MDMDGLMDCAFNLSVMASMEEVSKSACYRQQLEPLVDLLVTK